MSKLTEERLNEIETDPIEACLTDDEITELIAAARANAKLVEAMKESLFVMEFSHKLKHPDWNGEASQASAIGKARAALAAAGVKP